MRSSCTLAWLTALLLVGCSADVSIPAAPAADDAVHAQRAAAFVEAMKPRRPGRPVVAIVALDEGTEITDFLLPHAVLQRADVADVRPVAPRGGRVRLYPTLEVEGVSSLARFDAAHPAGADYVIVPAMSEEDAPAITDWLARQHALGARIVGVCAGALVVANAGLLDGRRFATHWYARARLMAEHPRASYVPHQRYVVDRGVATTTGVTASIPTMLALIEALGGREKAAALAMELGVQAWSPAHDSTKFGLNARRRWEYVRNKLALWEDEDAAIVVHDRMDDVALALTVDAWSRTGHVRVQAVGPSPAKLRSGILLRAAPADAARRPLPLSADLTPMAQLDRTLCEIETRFGKARRAWVMMELEYAATARPCAR